MAGKVTKPILYSYFRSSASWRVRIALACKRIDYEYRAVNIIKDGGQQHTDDYKKLNPSRQVPTLIIDGLVLAQSLPIIEYIDDTRPGMKLLPVDPGKRCKARQIAEIINSGIQPLQNMTVLAHVNKLAGEQKKAGWAQYYINRGYEALENVLTETAGKFCVGDEISIADLCLVPQVYHAKRLNIDPTDFPIIKRIYDECLAQEYFKSASPTVQPDCPKDYID